MKNLIIRALSGFVFVSITIGAIYIDFLGLLFLFLFFAGLALFEYYQLCNNLKDVKIDKYGGLTVGVLSILIYGLVLAGYLESTYFIFPLILIPIVLLKELFHHSKQPIINTSLLVFGWVYIIVPFIIMFEIREINSFEITLINQPGKYLLALFLLTWTNDTFAYLTGRFLGRNKLFERISPKKTWEGTVGGFLFSILVGVLISFYLNETNLFWIISAVLISISATLGDLFQSLLKRNVGVKDSGNIMPGHGGMLDRFDAILFAAPIFYLWIHYFTK